MAQADRMAGTMIDTGHGVVTDAQNLFVHRNFFDAQAFARYLRDRPAPYVPLPRSLDGGGDSFTLDDATVAAADAAKIAIQGGHAVTIFVNGYNVSESTPYFFARLNAALDAATATHVVFDGKRHPVRSQPEKARFRKHVKRRLAPLGAEQDRQDLVTEVGRLLGVDAIVVPEHLRTLTVAEIRGLIAQGVDIQNHGWTHTRVGAMNPADHARDIRRGREWLEATFGITADLFAVPNGDGYPQPGPLPACRAWLLLDEEPSDRIGAGTVNRQTLMLGPSQRAKSQSLFRRLKSLLK